LRDPPNPPERNLPVPQKLMYKITIIFHILFVIGIFSCTIANACVFSPQTELTTPTDSEDRTPGRLQAVWPPPKPKDEEEKVGLKYTEAGKNLELLWTRLSVFKDKEC